MSTINPNAVTPVVQGTQPATITDKKSSAIAAGISKVGSAALSAVKAVGSAALSAVKAVGIVFAIIGTAGLILANKNFRQMASNYFVGEKVPNPTQTDNLQSLTEYLQFFQSVTKTMHTTKAILKHGLPTQPSTEQEKVNQDEPFTGTEE